MAAGAGAERKVLRAIEHGTGGAPECLHLSETRCPEPGVGEILVEVFAAGVNRPDVLQRQGRYPPPPGASPRLGLELAGRVAACGAGTKRWHPGDAVCALAPGGAYAEFCCVPEAHAFPVPSGIEFTTAAALPETWFTVWANLIQIAHMKTGERLLVHGGASGIGLTAIQLAQWLGAETWVTVGSEAKKAFCEGYGVRRAINYRQEDFAEVIKGETQGTGVDVVLDMVGAPYFQRNLAALRRDGRLVNIAYLEGSRAEVDLLPIMLKRLVVTGSTLRPRSHDEKAMIREALESQLWPQWASGKLLPHLHAIFPLAEASQAHVLMESNAHIGKIVLEVRANAA